MTEPGRSDDGSTNTAALLADEMRGLSASEMREASGRYRALREASELQEVVFGGGMANTRRDDESD